ncbi:MAG: radical SAM protein [Nitrospiraceae bacterium]|nr:radical SAM protein [Nitrospiraceae bacterium]
MKTLSYADFSSRLHEASAGKRIPVNATLELTYRCNNRCVHCYCSLPANDPSAAGELSTAEIKRLFDGLASMGSLWLLLTGGEPLLREDFEEIYMHAKKKGFLITFFTNGTMVDEEIVALLAKYPPFVVEITLYGSAEETYEKVTRVKGSYKKCLSGIEKILKAGIQLKLKTMALTINQHEIAEMDRMAREWGCEFRFDPVIQKRIDGNDYSTPESCRIPPEEVVQLDKTFPKKMEEYRKFCDRFIKGPAGSRRLYRCGAGVGSVHVNPCGLATGCSMMVRNSFSVREHSLGWIWEEGIRSVIDRGKDFPLPCDDCRLVNLCGQCAAWSILENGGPEKEVEYLCRIAKIKEKEFDFLRR